jgi:Gram-negative bacterial TonB protein C-terminal
MPSRLSTCLVMTGLLAANPAAAKDVAPISLAMTSKWEINYDEDSCHLLARFGQGNDQVIMRLTRFEPGSKFDLMLYGKIFAERDAWVSASIAFGSASTFRRTVGAGSNGDLPFVIALNLRFDSTGPTLSPPKDEVSPADEAHVNSINISVRGSKARQLEAGSMAAPMQAMRICTDDLIRSWGYDPATMASLSRPPISKTSPASWISDNDYPSSALRAGNNGIVQFRLDVDESGTVAGCKVLRRMKPDDFAKVTCQSISRRAHFGPALDAAGKPIKAYCKVYHGGQLDPLVEHQRPLALLLVPGVLDKPQLRRDLLRRHVPCLDHASHALPSMHLIEPRQRRIHRLAGNALPPVVGVNDPARFGHVVEAMREAAVGAEYADVGDNLGHPSPPHHEGAVAPQRP